MHKLKPQPRPVFVGLINGALAWCLTFAAFGLQINLATISTSVVLIIVLGVVTTEFKTIDPEVGKETE